MNAAPAIMIEYLIRRFGTGRRTILVEEGESLTQGHDGKSYCPGIQKNRCMVVTNLSPI